MKRLHQLVAATNGYAYEARVPAARPASDYTARLIPYHDAVTAPLEAPQILWQR
jgi:glycogen phosphorylase